MNPSVHPYLSEFFAAWPFHAIPVQIRNQVAERLRLCSFEPGEIIYASQELPSAVHYVVQERIRLLGATQEQTLTVVGKGDVVGWDSLLRRVAAGTVRAAAPQSAEQSVITLALPADDFEALALQYLLPTLMQRVGWLELADVLSRLFAESAQGSLPGHERSPLDRSHAHPFLPSPVAPMGTNWRKLVEYIHQEQLAIALHWQPFRAGKKVRSEQATVDLSPDRLWLLSGGDGLSVPVGTIVTSLATLTRARSAKFPVRLIGINRSLLSSVQHPNGSSHPVATALPDRSSRPPDLQPTPAVPTPSRDRAYPIWRSTAPDPVEDVVACFGMICDRLQVPYRATALRRTLAPAINRFEPIELYLRIAQGLSLDARVVRFTPTPGGLYRLAPPVLLQCHAIPTVLHHVTPNEAIVGSPRTGLLRLTLTDLAARLQESPASGSNRAVTTCEAIALQRFPSTPTRRFGLHWFKPVLTRQRTILGQVLLASIVIQLLGIANPLLVQQIIDGVIINSNAGAMTVFGILMLGFALLEGILTTLRTYLLLGTTNRIDLHLGVEIVRHLLHLPLPFFEKRAVGDLTSRLLELETIRQFITDTGITTAMDVLFSVFYIAVMFLYSTRLTLCVLLTVPVVVLSTLLMSNIQKQLIRIKAEQGAKVQSYTVEMLSGISSVKSLHMEALTEATWREKYVQYLSSGFTASTINTIFYSYSQFLNTASSLLVLWVGADLVLKGELTLGGLIAFRILTGYVTGPLLRLARLWQQVQETSLSIELLADIADAPAEEELTQETGLLQLPAIAGHVQYYGVSFGFQPGQRQLSDVELDIPAGTFVGIVGQSGSGKSTLMKLLPRLYLPQSGKVSVDGYDVSKVTLESLRSQIGIVSQDAVLFQGTVRDNIALFESLSDDEVMAAAKVAHAHDFIMQLPDGYNTAVGERGTTLSGGQRQRIAIARIVTRNPQLLIFDEATSALDYETERQVCQNLMRRFQNRTCFFITHRLNTIASADWIIFMQSGMIAEQGTHEELMARRQMYYCLYSQQSRQV